MKCIIDIESNSLIKPTKIWLVVCKDIETNKVHIFRNIHEEDYARRDFIEFAKMVDLWIGHNIIEYDLPILSRIAGLVFNAEHVIDTLILSRLVNYSKPTGHSIRAYGEEFGLEKIEFNDWTKWSQEMEDYCVRDVEINHRIYNLYRTNISDVSWNSAIRLEHDFQLIVNDLHDNGFAFNVSKANRLLDKVSAELEGLDAQIRTAFPDKEVLIREFEPKPTRFGTISKTSVPRSLWHNIHEYEIGRSYRHTRMEPFNPSSHKQLIEVLNNAGWRPEERTQSHIDTQRQVDRYRTGRSKTTNVAGGSRANDSNNNVLDSDYDNLCTKLEALKKTGWRVNEANLSTLPKSAPEGARLLAKRILLEARRRSLTEWLGLVCIELRISKESAGVSGTERPVTPNPSTEEKSTSKEELYTAKYPLKEDKKEIEKAGINTNMDYQLKKLIPWLRSKKVYVEFVKENESYLWITVTGREQYEVFCVTLATEVLDGTSLKQVQYEITSSRIHGKFQGLGAWSHRMSHQRPNTANIPTAVQMDGSVKLLGKELRELWCAPKGKVLVGVDAEGIQLRIFAHYINDPEFTEALVRGRKDDKSDPHSLNQRILGRVCKTRQAAKRFVYALLLGAGIGKLSQILECSISETQQALEALLRRYTGFQTLKETIIPADAKRGYFIGLDGRKVKIPGESERDKQHLCMSGYLQNGEAIVIKRAALFACEKIRKTEGLSSWKYVDIVHDELQSECDGKLSIAESIAKIKAQAIVSAGEFYKLRCPMAGSYWNDDTKRTTIGVTWYQTH